MGQLVIYHITKNKDSLAIFFRSNYKDFRQWCLNESGYTECLSSESQNFLLENELLPMYQEIERGILDDLAAHFINVYCGIVKTGLLVTLNPLMKRDHYLEARAEIEKRCSVQTLKLWNYLLTGRTLLDGSEIGISQDGHRLGYWTTDEQKYLREEFIRVFGKESSQNGIRYAQQVLNETFHNTTELIILTS